MPTAFELWRKRKQAREALASGDPWVCPYCREVHPAFEVGGSKFGFGYPSVKLACCGKTAFMLKDPKTQALMRFVRIGDGSTEWMPKEAYFAWLQNQAVPRGHREGSPHAEVVAKGIVQDVASLRPKPKEQVAADSTPAPAAPTAAPATKPLTFIAVAKANEVTEKQGRVVTVNGKAIALFRVKDGIVAIDDTCAHARTSLGNSVFEDGVVTCNGHGWRYDVRTGVCENRPDISLATYPVKVEGETVLVGA